MGNRNGPRRYCRNKNSLPLLESDALPALLPARFKHPTTASAPGASQKTMSSPSFLLSGIVGL